MANSNGWGDGAANNAIGWGQGANNAIGWGDSHAKSWAGLTDIVGLTTDPDAQAFITAAAITDPTQQAAIDNLVKGLKSDNIWTKMKAIYPFVGGTASTHKWNLKDPRDLDAAFRLVFNGGWTHSSNGATPNGTNGYADTKLVPLSVLSSANNMSFGYYSRTIGGAAETRMSMGAFDGGSDSSLIIRWNNGFSYNNLNETLYTALYTNADTHGFYVANRNATNLEQGWKNGIKKIEVVNIPTTRTNKNVYLGAMNNNIAPLYFDNKQTAFAHIAEGLTDTEAANLYTRVQAYQTALSRQV